MNTGARRPPKGRPAPKLVLCRQCIRYVFEGTAICPHCGGDALEASQRYRDEGYLAIEIMQRIDRLRDGLRADESDC
jgi:hypothetical protein